MGFFSKLKRGKDTSESKVSSPPKQHEMTNPGFDIVESTPIQMSEDRSGKPNPKFKSCPDLEASYQSKIITIAKHHNVDTLILRTTLRNNSPEAIQEARERNHEKFHFKQGPEDMSKELKNDLKAAGLEFKAIVGYRGKPYQRWDLKRKIQGEEAHDAATTVTEKYQEEMSSSKTQASEQEGASKSASPTRKTQSESSKQTDDQEQDQGRPSTPGSFGSG